MLNYANTEIAKLLSLCPAGDTGTIPFESPALCPHHQFRIPSMSAALSSTRCTLRSRQYPAAAASPANSSPVPPSASLTAPLNSAEREALTERYYLVLSMTRSRALATVADCISMWLPWHALVTRSKRAAITVMSCFTVLLNFSNFSNFHNLQGLPSFANHVLQVLAKFC